MKNSLVLFILSIVIMQNSLAQTKFAPAEQKMVDSLCSSVNKLDLSKITTKEQAIFAYTQCVTNYYSLLGDFAEEKHADISNTADMKKIGIQLAQDLMTIKCESFIKLESLIAKNTIDNQENSTTGIYKRIDNKGFNYVVIIDENQNEKSFIWLRQFPESENFMTETNKFAGKKLKISWHEMEVYLPSAKGYYKVKEISAIKTL
jgi:hypothetical protein